eukprot:5254987-Alexandrium_andersonii.AAC.1
MPLRKQLDLMVVYIAHSVRSAHVSESLQAVLLTIRAWPAGLKKLLAAVSTCIFDCIPLVFGACLAVTACSVACRCCSAACS